ncbi:MAG: hypothetical protein ACE5OY_07475 [Candidatus Bathyarchaeia archaeon]
MESWGGLHLRRADRRRIESTILELKDIGISLLAASHCTGIRALFTLHKELEEETKVFTVGDSIRIGSVI